MRLRAASFFVTRKSEMRPVFGLRNGTEMPCTSGKLCSQTGSWTITGTMSQRCSIAVSQLSCGGGIDVVGDAEDEAARRHGARMMSEVLERLRDTVLGRVEPVRHEALLAQLT